MRVLLALLLLFALPALAEAQATESENFERFILFADCGPILLVTHVDDESQFIDLTEERVRTLAENRLRAARLYAGVPKGMLVVTVSVVGFRSGQTTGTIYNTTLKFDKPLEDPLTGMEGTGTTWWDGRIGIADHAETILSGLSERMDEFILRYLRVNQEAC